MPENAFFEIKNLNPLSEREKAAAEGEELWMCPTCGSVWKRKQLRQDHANNRLNVCADYECDADCFRILGPKRFAP